jgi:hypothetical protein
MQSMRAVVVSALSVWIGLGGLVVPDAVGQSCVAVTTYHNDNFRTGQNLSETVLTPANVGTMTQLFVTPPAFDGWAVAQPLYLPQTPINGGVHNVVFVATLANSVYAFDADHGTEYWHVVYGPPDTYGYQKVGGCTDSGFSQNPSGGAGIVGTPVIDTSVSPPVMYFVTKELNYINLQEVHQLKLHAVNTSTGAELTTPIVLQGSVVNHSGKTVNFSAEFQMSRPGMLLSNGTIYIGIGSTGCREYPNFGWIMSYTYSATNGFAQQAVFNTSPDLTNNPKGPYANGGVWQAGGGLTADASGNIFFETADANNFFNNSAGWQGTDFGDSIVKLTPSLGAPASSASYFTPYNDKTLYSADLDLSSTGPVLLPDQPGLHTHILVGYDKSEEIYVVDRDNMGGYTGPNGPNNIVQDVPDPTTVKCSTVTQFTHCANQSGTCGWNAPVYWNNNLYFSSNPGPLMSYAWTPGSTTPLATCPTIEGGFASGNYNASASPSISANGSSAGLLWVVTWPKTREGTLRAFDATNLGSQLFEASLSGVGGYPTPTIANGIVYVTTKGRLYAFGIKKSSGCRTVKGAASAPPPLDPLRDDAPSATRKASR